MQGKPIGSGAFFPMVRPSTALLYDKPFTVAGETAGDQSASLLLEYAYRNDDPGYPFQYNCQVRYILHAGGDLEIVTTVTNVDRITIPMADGWHPYFRLGGKIDEWHLQFYSEAIVDFDQRLIPTGHLSPYNVFEKARPIGDTFLDNCFTLKPAIVSAACELYNPASGLRISFFPEASYPYLQVVKLGGRPNRYHHQNEIANRRQARRLLVGKLRKCHSKRGTWHR